VFLRVRVASEERPVRRKSFLTLGGGAAILPPERRGRPRGRPGESVKRGFLFLLLSLCAASAPFAATSPDLADTTETHFIRIDGYSSDFVSDEGVFGTTLKDVNGDGIVELVPQERTDDSKWGFNNDLNQIKITWDAENLYVAVDGISWDNNIILLFDYLPGGLDRMTELNSWRRNFVFSNEFYPDLFLATWDGNTTPQIWRFSKENQVEQVDISQFETVATFAQGNTGRSMEARIPWSVFYGSQPWTRAYDEEFGDSVYVLDAVPGLDHAKSIHLCAILTAGPDGTGGPDSAPDNFGGHTIESSDQVTIDNYAIVPLDTTYYVSAFGEQLYLGLNGDTANDNSILREALAEGDSLVDTVFSDGSPDLDSVLIQNRIRFLEDPPIQGIRFSISEIRLNRPVIAPEKGDELKFVFDLDPRLTAEGRNVKVSAEVYNMRGRRIRTIFEDVEHSAADILGAQFGFWPGWDGYDEEGRMAPGGIYVLRLVIEPGVNRLTKAFSVVQ